MSDPTALAEALISTVARAFYNDDVICVIDYLLREKFIKDVKGMGQCLSVSTKWLRKTLEFLRKEHLVWCEECEMTVETKDSRRTYRRKKKATFWYIDYHRAVHTIRFRVYMMQKKIQDAEESARSTSTYECPGYAKKICNGRYSEMDAQTIIDDETGTFLCFECESLHRDNPDPPPKSTYTLKLLDNTENLMSAMVLNRRISEQLKPSFVGGSQLRPGICNLLKALRTVGKDPLISNLPSDNGATEEIRWENRIEEEDYDKEKEITCLTNALGQRISLKVEKGSGTRANYWATRMRTKSVECKLVNSAVNRAALSASKASTNLLGSKRNENNDDTFGLEKVEKPPNKIPCRQTTPTFLHNNIGKDIFDEERGVVEFSENNEQESEDDSEESIIEVDFYDEIDVLDLSKEEERKAFQRLYMTELKRQVELLGSGESHRTTSDSTYGSVAWEAG